MMRFWIGETVRVRCTFTDEAGARITPTGVAFAARSKSGQHVAADPLATTEAGAFYADFTFELADVWYLRASCSGPTSAVVEDQIEVRASMVL